LDKRRCKCENCGYRLILDNDQNIDEGFDDSYYDDTVWTGCVLRHKGSGRLVIMCLLFFIS